MAFHSGFWKPVNPHAGFSMFSPRTPCFLMGLISYHLLASNLMRIGVTSLFKFQNEVLLHSYFTLHLTQCEVVLFQRYLSPIGVELGGIL